MAPSALLRHTLDLNFVSTWVLAPESNPSDVKGEGTRKNNMEITWTVRVPPRNRSVHPGALGLDTPETQGRRVAQTPRGLVATLVCAGQPGTKRERV